MTAVAAAEVERRRDLILTQAFLMLFGRGPLDWITFTTNALTMKYPHGSISQHATRHSDKWNLKSWRIPGEGEITFVQVCWEFRVRPDSSIPALTVRMLRMMIGNRWVREGKCEECDRTLFTTMQHATCNMAWDAIFSKNGRWITPPFLIVLSLSSIARLGFPEFGCCSICFFLQQQQHCY